jgi:integrase
MADNLRSDKLKKLADSLPSFVLNARAQSTNVKYKNAWLCWKKWEKENVGCNEFPVSPLLFCLYLRDKVESCKSSAPIESAVYGVRWAHMVAGVCSPTDDIMVKQMLEACKRLLGKPVVGKQPLGIDVIVKVAEHFFTPRASLSNLRTCFICVIAFAGLMRVDEIIKVRRKDVVIVNDYMTVFCSRRKNDQLSKGHTIFFARSGKITCPVSITEQLLAKLPLDPEQHLVCRLSSNGVALMPSISYSRVREIFRETLKLFISDSSCFGTHSLKKGGATALSSAGVSGELIDKHAGWKSVKSKESYIEYSTDDKLRASRAMNL